ncbi:hypothetical protein EJA72_02765 [Pseudomonas sp. PB120]|nr:hypothetical protein [Pseudomonas sp. PB120]
MKIDAGLLGAAFVARELAPARLRSSRNQADAVLQRNHVACFGTAAQSSGSKLPRHIIRRPYEIRFRQWLWRAARHWRSSRRTAR